MALKSILARAKVGVANLPVPLVDTDIISEIALAVYKNRLDDLSGSGPGSVDRVLAEDNDGGVKLAGRSRSYQPIVRAVIVEMAALGYLDLVDRGAGQEN